MLVSIKNGHTLENDYKVSSVLTPLFASDEDAEITGSNMTIAAYGFVLSLIIPLVLFIVMKSNIEKFFQMYYMFQIIGNIKNLSNITLPASVIPTILVVESATNF